MTELRMRMLQDLRVRNYSPRTLQCYISLVARFAKHFKKSPALLGPEEIRSYLVFLVEEKKVSVCLMRQMVAALRFLYQTTLGREWPSRTIPMPKQPKKLPFVLSRSQVTRLIQVTSNLKHRLILMTLYATGARISELASIKMEDINSERMTLLLNGKGRKERLVPLSPVLLAALRDYWRRHRPPQPWLFPGKSPERPMCRDAIGRIVERARRAANLPDRMSAHTLRHCFATHHLENGVHLLAIQQLLGHASIHTTMIYTHVTSKALTAIKSPLDLLPEIPPFAGTARSEPSPGSP